MDKMLFETDGDKDLHMIDIGIYCTIWTRFYFIS